MVLIYLNSKRLLRSTLQQDHLREHDTFKSIIDPVIYMLTSHTARTKSIYQICSPNLNFKFSSLQDNDLQRFRALLLLALRYGPDISILGLMRTCCCVLLLKDKRVCQPMQSSPQLMWVLLLPKAALHRYFCFLCCGRQCCNRPHFKT